jgi:hypothetical protein
LRLTCDRLCPQQVRSLSRRDWAIRPGRSGLLELQRIAVLECIVHTVGYLDHETWWRDIASGEYKAWMDKNYGFRSFTPAKGSA